MTPRRRPIAGGVLLEYDALESTQDEARRRVHAGEEDVLGVRAGFQSAGRGRRGGVWIAPPDTCLLVTYLLRGYDCRPESVGSLAFVVGVGVARALERAAGVQPGLKWPNDVLLGGRKVAGVLIETAGAPSGSAVALAGIGLNVNVTDFPLELVEQATSLALATGTPWPVEDLEKCVREELAWARLLAAREGLAPILEQWRRRDATTGARFTATIDGREVAGTAVGIADTGALRLCVDDGEVVEALSATSA